MKTIIYNTENGIFEFAIHDVLEQLQRHKIEFKIRRSSRDCKTHFRHWRILEVSSMNRMFGFMMDAPGL
jgi:hypothetical protein